MEFKRKYDPEEIKEVIAWFENHMNEFPSELDIIPGVTTKNLPKMIRGYIDLASHNAKNITFQGQISHMFQIRELLQKQGIGV